MRKRQDKAREKERWDGRGDRRKVGEVERRKGKRDETRKKGEKKEGDG